MAVVMCHTHYTLTQRETSGLIENTLPNKNLKTCDGCIIIEILKGKHTRPASSMLTQH